MCTATPACSLRTEGTARGSPFLPRHSVDLPERHPPCFLHYFLQLWQHRGCAAALSPALPPTNLHRSQRFTSELRATDSASPGHKPGTDPLRVGPGPGGVLSGLSPARKGEGTGVGAQSPGARLCRASSETPAGPWVRTRPTRRLRCWGSDPPRPAVSRPPTGRPSLSRTAALTSSSGSAVSRARNRFKPARPRPRRAQRSARLRVTMRRSRESRKRLGGAARGRSPRPPTLGPRPQPAPPYARAPPTSRPALRPLLLHRRSDPGNFSLTSKLVLSLA